MCRLCSLRRYERTIGGRGVCRQPSSTEWVGLWSLSLGIAAVLMAAIVYFAGRDSVGASFTLFGTAALVALMMRASANPDA